MTDCSCIYVGDADGTSFWNEKQPTAKKSHVCCECGEVIEPGQKYQYECGQWDGDFAAYKTCLDCLSVRQAFFCDGYAFGGMWGYVADHINEMRGQIKSDCIVGLPKNARDRICDMIDEFWKGEENGSAI